MQLRKIICHIFGHEFTGFYTVKTDDGLLLREEKDCSRCRHVEVTGLPMEVLTAYENPTKSK